MMEMRVKNGVFYLLDTGDEKWVYDTEGDAIGALKKLASGAKEIDHETLNILEVNTEGENWQIKAMPWSKIAIGLMKGGK